MNLKKRVNQNILAIKPYVPGKSIQEVSRSQGASDIIKMASNENPLGMCPAAIEAIKQSLISAYQYPEITCARILFGGKIVTLSDIFSGKYELPPIDVVTVKSVWFG